MKRSVVILALVAVVCLCGSAEAAVEATAAKTSLAGRWYIGGGFQFDIPNFRVENYGGLEDYDLDNTWGGQIKFGGFVLDFLALEALFQYHDSFKWENKNYLGSGVDAEVKIQVYDFSINGKGYIPLEGIFKPYGVLGLGYGVGKATSKTTFPHSISYTGTDSGSFGRIGAGCDLILSDAFGLEAEVAYNAGFGDIDYARFTAISGSALIFF